MSGYAHYSKNDAFQAGVLYTVHVSEKYVHERLARPFESDLMARLGLVRGDLGRWKEDWELGTSPYYAPRVWP